VARETPSAAQVAASISPVGASDTTASVKARRRWAPAGCPATPQLFLDSNDRLGACQAQRQTRIFLLQQSNLGGERVRFVDFRAPPGGCQRAERSGVALTAPLAKGR